MNVCDMQVHRIYVPFNTINLPITITSPTTKVAKPSLPFLTHLNNITIPNTTQSLNPSFSGPYYSQHPINTFLPKSSLSGNSLFISFHPNPFKLTPTNFHLFPQLGSHKNLFFFFAYAFLKAMNFRSLEEFWAFYVNQHSMPSTRRWHFVGTLFSILFLFFSVFFSWWFLFFVPLSGYGCAWYSHFFVEGNVPATFGHPFWSLLCDFKMFGLMLTGKMDREIKRLGKRPVLQVF